ncbi:MAG: hypothetical protein RL757_1951 [Bacteroidota bacterium]|jgi:hypothetical protein
MIYFVKIYFDVMAKKSAEKFCNSDAFVKICC